MSRTCLPLVVVALLAAPAAAQPSAPPEPANAPAPESEPPIEAVVSADAGPPSFEQEVAAQLATQGVALASRHLALRLDQDGDAWTAALVDAGSGRAVASVRIDALPQEHDAAVAAATRSVTRLAERVDHRVNELKFKLHALRFARTYDTEAPPGHHPDHRWQVFRGKIAEELDATEFYQAVGRDDLASSYRRRRLVMLGGYGLALAGFLTAAILNLSPPGFSSCDGLTGPSADQCANEQDRSAVPTVVALGVGLGGALLGTWYYRHPQPIDETDARALADAYNQRLRHALGIASVARAPRFTDVQLTPFATGAGAGLVLGARF